MDINGRPLVGNSVLRIWRETRLSHTIARTQSALWDTTPHPEPVTEDPVDAAGIDHANQARIGLERFSEEMGPDMLSEEEDEVDDFSRED